MGHSGVVVKVAEAGLKSPPQQPQILQALLEAFHADKDTRCCVPLLLTLTAYEVYSEHKEKMESDKDINRVSTCIFFSFTTRWVMVFRNILRVCGIDSACIHRWGCVMHSLNSVSGKTVSSMYVHLYVAAQVCVIKIM